MVIFATRSMLLCLVALWDSFSTWLCCECVQHTCCQIVEGVFWIFKHSLHVFFWGLSATKVQSRYSSHRAGDNSPHYTNMVSKVTLHSVAATTATQQQFEVYTPEGVWDRCMWKILESGLYLVILTRIISGSEPWYSSAERPTLTTYELESEWCSCEMTQRYKWSSRPHRHHHWAISTAKCQIIKVAFLCKWTETDRNVQKNMQFSFPHRSTWFFFSFFC